MYRITDTTGKVSTTKSADKAMNAADQGAKVEIKIGGAYRLSGLMTDEQRAVYAD